MIGERAFLFVLSVLSCLILSCSTNELDSKPYFYIYELEPSTKMQLSLLKSISRDSASYAILNDMYTDSRVDILVSPEKKLMFEQMLNDVGMKYEYLERNTAAELEVKPGNEYNWKQYHTLNNTYNWMRSLSKLYPEQASLFVAGKSYEGRDLLGIKISFGDDKKAIFLEGGIHAREWISPATTTFIAHQLLTSQREDIRMVAENFDWYILPHANPDGYVYTYTTNRFWRKTRSPQDDGCYGVDLNRNWDFHWNELDPDRKPCDDTYAGPKAFSEIEARTLADYIIKLKSKLFLYVSFHSFRQKLLYPYGYTSKLPPNNAAFKRVYNAAIAALSERYGTKYTGGNIYDNMYPASGVSIDWAYAVAGVNFSFAYELCPSNSHFFDFRLPAARIIPTGEETLDSLVAMVKAAAIEKSDVTKNENENLHSGAQRSKIPIVQIFVLFPLYLLKLLL